MEKKALSLRTNNDKFFRQFLEVMNFIVKITPQERDVLAELIKLDFEYEALPQDKRTRFILSTDSRKEICSKIDIKDKQFNVILSNLKNKYFNSIPLLDSNNYIHPELKVKPDDEGFTFQVIFVNQKNSTTQNISKKIEEKVEKKKEIKKEIIENVKEQEINDFPPINDLSIKKYGTVGEIIEEPKIEFTLMPPENES